MVDQSKGSLEVSCLLLLGEWDDGSGMTSLKVWLKEAGVGSLNFAWLSNIASPRNKLILDKHIPRTKAPVWGLQVIGMLTWGRTDFGACEIGNMTDLGIGKIRLRIGEETYKLG